MSSIRLAATGVALTVILVACGDSDTAAVVDDVAAPASTTGPTATAGSELGSESIGVEPRLVPTVAGGQLDLNSIEGQDTVLWFWAPW